MTGIFARTLFFTVLALVFATSNGKSFLARPQSISIEIASEDTAIRPEPRIIGAETAKSTVAPYIASLSISSVAYGHLCGAVIISKVWLITAAHCLAAEGAVGLPVYAGLKDRNDLENAQIRHIDYAIAHKHFNGKEGSDDIALLHVSPPFEFNGNVSSISLPMFHEDFSGQLSTTYGWGLENADATLYVNDLRVAHGNVLNQKECRKNLPDDAPVSPRTICVRVPSCYGDGGSPLAIEYNGYPLQLIGITSWAYVPCGYEGRPTAFTAISHYVDWIAQIQWAYSILHDKI